jgi:transcriptional regulator with XRE-family HTH domain
VAEEALARGTLRVRRYTVAGPDKPERDDVLLEFGQKLKAFRRAAGFTQERLGVYCFVPGERISGLEAGKRAADVPELLVIADRLGVSAVELIAGLEAPLRRVGTAQVLDKVICQPGITAKELATSLKMPYSYAFEITIYLQATGAIISHRTGWHPTTATTRNTTGS